MPPLPTKVMPLAAAPPLESSSVPLLQMTVAEALPPELTTSKPPFEITAAMELPPASTRWPPIADRRRDGVAARIQILLAAAQDCVAGRPAARNDLTGVAYHHGADGQSRSDNRLLSGDEGVAGGSPRYGLRTELQQGGADRRSAGVDDLEARARDNRTDRKAVDASTKSAYQTSTSLRWRRRGCERPCPECSDRSPAC